MGVSGTDSKLKKIISLKCLLLLFYSTANHFSSGLWCVTKSGFYTTGDDQLSGWTEKKLQSISQSQTWTKNRSWSLFGGLLLVGSTTAFWIPVKPLHLRSLLSKLIRKNCNACSWHRSTDRTQFFSMKMPGCRLQNKHFKSWTNWATKFCLICHIHLISCQSTCQSPLLQASPWIFAGKMLPQTTGGRKCFPRVCQIPKYGLLHYRNKKLIIDGKNVLIVMVPILVKKDVFELSYNDLTFMVWNHNYFFVTIW